MSPEIEAGSGTRRVIACLDVDDGRVVKGTNFVDIRDAGDPVELAERYDAEGADELVFLDITALQSHSMEPQFLGLNESSSPSSTKYRPFWSRTGNQCL